MAVNNETLQSLRNAVRADTQESSVTGLISDASIDRWLNEAQLEAIKESGFIYKEQSITTIASQAAYDLPDDFQDLLSVQYQQSSRNEKLEPMTKDRYLYDSVINEVSIPSKFVIIGDSIYIYQTPATSGDNISHWYTAYPDKLSDDTDVPFNNIKKYYPYHLGLINFANAKVFQKGGDTKASTTYMQNWLLFLAKMKADMATRNKGGHQMARWDRGRNEKIEHPYIPDWVT